MKKAILLCVLVGVLCTFAVAEGVQQKEMSKTSYESQQEETKSDSSWFKRGIEHLKQGAKHVSKHVKQGFKYAKQVVKKGYEHAKRGAKFVRNWYRKAKRFIKRKLGAAGKAFVKLLRKKQKGHVDHTKYLQRGMNFYSDSSPLNCAVEDVDDDGEMEAEAVCADRLEEYAGKSMEEAFLEIATRDPTSIEKTMGPGECDEIMKIFSPNGGLPTECPDDDVFNANDELIKCLVSVYEGDSVVEFENRLNHQSLKVFKQDDGISYSLDCVGNGNGRRRLLRVPGGTSAGS